MEQVRRSRRGNCRTTNSIVGWHYSLQAIFMCSHPTLWTFLTGIHRDSQLSVTSFLQASAGVVHIGKKTYRDLKERVQRTIATYDQTDLLTYLQAIAYLSHA